MLRQRRRTEASKTKMTPTERAQARKLIDELADVVGRMETAADILVAERRDDLDHNRLRSQLAADGMRVVELARQYRVLRFKAPDLGLITDVDLDD